MYALDTFNDNLCLFRCIAVYKGARPDRCTEIAQQLAVEYYGEEATACPKLELDQLRNVEVEFRIGIRVYEPS